MDQLFDTLARILATPMSRRKALGLAGGALATAVVAALGVQPVNAQPPVTRQPNDATCTPQQTHGWLAETMTQRRRDGGDASAARPARAARTPAGRRRMLQAGQCVCANGTCAASNGGKCPSGCTRCNG